MAVKTETLGGISQPAVLRKFAISKVLDHIVECLAVPNDDVVGLYDELGISCHQVEQEVHRRRTQLGVQQGLVYSHLESSTQVKERFALCIDKVIRSVVKRWGRQRNRSDPRS